MKTKIYIIVIMLAILVVIAGMFIRSNDRSKKVDDFVNHSEIK